MKGASFLIEFHPWRGVGLVAGQPTKVLVLAFVSLQVTPFLLTDWLKAAFEKLK